MSLSSSSPTDHEWVHVEDLISQLQLEDDAARDRSTRGPEPLPLYRLPAGNALGHGVILPVAECPVCRVDLRGRPTFASRWNHVVGCARTHRRRPQTMPDAGDVALPAAFRLPPGSPLGQGVLLRHDQCPVCAVDLRSRASYMAQCNHIVGCARARRPNASQ
ncbi:Uncharacterized protein PBTT_05107 [Plasmodiophora brassicae]